MHLFAFFLRKIRTNNFFQLVFFGLLSLLAFYKIFSFWFFHGWETSWYAPLIAKFSLLDAMKTHGLIAYINYSFFGWRPFGWFAVALILHLAVAMVINLFISRKTNRIVGLVAGLLFLVTTAHHDVITWGTFESLYAAQTLCLYAGLWFFDLYMESKRLIWYVAMFVIFLLSLLIRESGLLFIPMVFFFDVLFYGQIFKNKTKTWLHIFVQTIRRHVLLWIVGGAYLALRSSYGGSANDFIDERIQFSILLFHEHRYAEYVVRGLLSFGYFIGPYLIPYPFLNFFRDIVLSIFPSPLLKIYFFTSFGWICYALFFYIAYRLRKQTYSAYIWFCFFSFTVVTFFYAFAWSVKDSFLATAYFWSENRWRYLGFTFFAAGLSIVGYNYFSVHQTSQKCHWFRKPTFGIALLVIYIVMNILLLHNIENQMYHDNSLPAVTFYKTFLKTFPKLTNKDSFYAFPGSQGIGDFFAELTTTSKTYYPNLSHAPTPWVRTELYYIFSAMKSKTSWADDVHFVDFDVTRGIVDHTKEIHDTFSKLAPTSLVLEYVGSSVSADVHLPASVDFRSDAAITYQGIPTAGNVSEQSQAVDAFSTKLADMSTTTHIDVCKTVGYPGEPIFDFRGDLVLDGNLSYRSFWWADCRPAWLVMDMGSEVTFSGAAWASVSKPDSVPRDYHYDISQDGKTWKDVRSINRNTKNSRIDVFSVPTNGRYLRFWVDETSYRQLLEVNEFVPLFPETVTVAKFYNDLPSLYASMYHQSGRVSWMRIRWKTTPDNGVSDVDRTIYEPIVVDGGWHEIHFSIPESDYYSTPGEFLRRKITHVDFETSSDVSLHINSAQLYSPFAY